MIVECKVTKGQDGWPFTATISENGKERLFECDFSEILDLASIPYSLEDGTVLMGAATDMEKIGTIDFLVDPERVVMYSNRCMVMDFDTVLGSLFVKDIFGFIKKIELKRWLTKKFEEAE